MLILCVVSKITLCAENGTSVLKKSLFHARSFLITCYVYLGADISQNLIHYIAFLRLQVTKQPIRKLELHHSNLTKRNLAMVA